MKYVICCVLILGMTPILFAQSNPISQDIKINPYVYGTLLKPESPTENLVIIIPGSGPTDRDGNQQMARNNSLRLLAEGITASGIATFRYDKRVLTLLKQRALQEEKLRFDDFVEDAVNTIKYFSERGNYSNIYVLGHSQGSLVGMIASQKTMVAGFISLAGAGQTIDKAIVNQIKLQMPDLAESAVKSFEELKENGKVKNYSPALSSIFRPSSQPFMASWMKYNPSDEIQKLQIPTLIINGTKDIQVDVSEAHSLKAVKDDASLIIIDTMNHILRSIKGDNLVNTKSYNEPQRPLSEGLIEAITTFVLK